MTTTRVERKTASAIECVTKTTVEPLASQMSQQLDVQPFARHLVERTERLVHEQESRIERQRARDRDALLHPAGELPGVVALEAAELDELEHLLDLGRRAVCGSSGPARAARAMFLATVRQS